MTNFSSYANRSKNAEDHETFLLEFLYYNHNLFFPSIPLYPLSLFLLIVSSFLFYWHPQFCFNVRAVSLLSNLWLPHPQYYLTSAYFIHFSCAFLSLFLSFIFWGHILYSKWCLISDMFSRVLISEFLALLCIANSGKGEHPIFTSTCYLPTIPMIASFIFSGRFLECYTSVFHIMLHKLQLQYGDEVIRFWEKKKLEKASLKHYNVLQEHTLHTLRTLSLTTCYCGKI